MAVGRMDYQAGVVPIKSGYGLLQTPFYKSEAISLAHGEDDFICLEVIAAGYWLSVSGVRVSCNWPGIQVATYKIGPYWETGRYYDQQFDDSFPDGAPMVVEGLLYVAIHIENNTGQLVTYNGAIFGYLEQIES